MDAGALAIVLVFGLVVGWIFGAVMSGAGRRADLKRYRLIVQVGDDKLIDVDFDQALDMAHVDMDQRLLLWFAPGARLFYSRRPHHNPAAE